MTDDELIRKLRQLPPEGEEPDWAMLEASIRARVASDAGRTPRAWWMSWRWLAPIGALAVTAGVALIVVILGDSARERAPHIDETEHHAPVREAAPTREKAPLVWLDGEPMEIDDVDDAQLDELDEAARDALSPDEEPEEGILLVDDLGWIDSLDESELQRAELWLAKKRS